MAGIQVVRDKPFLKKDNVTTGDITGIIGLADKLMSGSIALTFPEKTILKIYENMMGEAATEISAEVQDLVGELANMVAGGAKNEFSNFSALAFSLLYMNFARFLREKNSAKM